MATQPRKTTASLPISTAGQTPCYWADPVHTAAGTLNADPVSGLTPAEAAERLARDGRNEIRALPGPNGWLLFLGQFKSLVIWVLIGAAVVSAALGELADGIAILAIVLLNAGIGFAQEYHAEQSLTALRRLSAPLAHVIRGAVAQIIPAAEVVVGDLLVLEAGDLVSADARLLHADSLRINEAPLTGESAPVSKDAAYLAVPETPLADRRNMVYLGTTVSGGQGRALVVATGMETEVGRIATLLDEAGDGQTPLQQRLDQVGQFLLAASFVIVALVFVLGVGRGEPAGRMLLTAISLAIAAVPEGLPATVTIALALGVSRMVRRHALIRRLPAVETLGCAEVICSDKTGTLTVGAMTVREVWTGSRAFQVTGEGYDLTGSVLADGEPVSLDDPALRLLLTAAAACTEAELQSNASGSRVIGDPTEGALLVAAAKVGIDRAELEANYPRVHACPFDSQRKRMTIVRRAEVGLRVFTKGAPDVLVTRCTRIAGADGSIRSLTSQEHAAILEVNRVYASRALRVLAVAVRDVAEGEALPAADDALEADLTFVGLVAMQDPPRAEAREAVQRCHGAGIRVVMITGDHPDTAAAVAAELGILREADRVASGMDIQQLTETELKAQVTTISVFARVTAEDKLRIVRALKSRGLTVAMTGDGVNDAPAIREASIGVAMGISGTEVTKQASDMVITDDNFASIVAAVEEGRGVYDNIKKSLQYLLAGNTAEILVMLVAVLVGWPVPLLPLQLLWINLATDGLPALALASDPVSPNVLSQSPRSREEQLADGKFLRNVLATGTLTAAVALTAYLWGLHVQADLTAARSYAFTVLVFAELLRSFGARSLDRPLWRPGHPRNWRLTAVVITSLGLQLLIIYVPALQKLFGIAPIRLEICASLLMVGALPLLLLEAHKELVVRAAARAAQKA